MNTSKIRYVLALACAFFFTPTAAHAGEGMFLLDKLPAEGLTRSKLKVPFERIAKLAPAIVQVARGGTGSFVSGKGLLVTNHHVAFGCLARLNVLKEHKGIMDDGYVAKDMASELPCPGYDLLTVVKVEEVTAKVLEGVPEGTRKNFKARFEQVRANKEKLRKACEAGGMYICQVSQMNGGTAYYLSTHRRVRDVRMVYAPPKSMGKYGGDIDNWMFPRHTADFAFLRAYVGPGGKGTAHDKANRPMETPVHLRISPYGVHKGSLVQVIGFPGRTKRHVTSHSVGYQTEQHLPEVLDLLDKLLGEVNKRRGASKEAERKYMTLESRLQNALKYYRMSKKGFERWKVLDRKRRAEAAMKKRIKGSERKKYIELLNEMGGVYRRYLRFHRKHQALRWLTWAVPSVRVANDIARWGVEKGKPDAERKDDRYKDKNVYRFTEAAARLERETELATEKALLAFFLRRAMALPKKQRPGVLKVLKKITKAELKKAKGLKLTGDKAAQAAELLYRRTGLLALDAKEDTVKKAAARRKELLALDAKALAKVDDPLLRFALALEQEVRAIREGPFAEVEQYLGTVLHPRWVGKHLKPKYPDANFTARLSYGSVQDYTSTDTGKTHRYLTDLKGLLAKETGKWPFIVPAWLKEASEGKDLSSHPQADKRIKDIPVNFTCTLDTTGGNSGSPVLDDRGRLVGLLFDGTPESVLSDWQYLHKEQRSIVMDIRIARFFATLQGADALLAEITPPSPAEVRKLRVKLKKEKE